MAVYHLGIFFPRQNRVFTYPPSDDHIAARAQRQAHERLAAQGETRGGDHTRRQHAQYSSRASRPRGSSQPTPAHTVHTRRARRQRARARTRTVQSPPASAPTCVPPIGFLSRLLRHTSLHTHMSFHTPPSPSAPPPSQPHQLRPTPLGDGRRRRRTTTHKVVPEGTPSPGTVGGGPACLHEHSGRSYLQHQRERDGGVVGAAAFSSARVFFHGGGVDGGVGGRNGPICVSASLGLVGGGDGVDGW